MYYTALGMNRWSSNIFFYLFQPNNALIIACIIGAMKIRRIMPLIFSIFLKKRVATPAAGLPVNKKN